MRIGILGGSFDPVHEGHLHIAKKAIDSLKLSKVLFIPANLSPFKLTEDLAPAPHRLEMVRLAVAGQSLLEVSDVDIKRGGVSYTVETLRQLKTIYPPETLFFLIMGGDTFAQLDSWKNAQEIKDACEIAVAVRPNYSLKASPKISLITQETLPYSSTEIRRDLGTGKTPAGLPLAVLSYIQNHNLYL